MNRLVKIKLFAFALALTALLLSSCSAGGIELWENAIYTSDSSVGEGSVVFTLTVEAAEKEVDITVKCDGGILGDVLYGYGLINDPAFFDVANGIKASWSEDKAYWSFFIGDDFAPVGVDALEVTQGASYKFVYTK